MQLSFMRDQLAEVVGTLVRNLRPKDKDPVLRRMLYILPNGDGKTCGLFATNEVLSAAFLAVGCTLLDGDAQPLAVEIARLSKLVSLSNSDTIEVTYDETSPKLLVKSGHTKAEISYITGDEYEEILGKPPISNIDADFLHVEKLKDVQQVLRVMLGCTDVRVPHLSGVFTDGNDTYLSTDRYKGMAYTGPGLGFRAVIPADFISLLELFGDEVDLYWRDGLLWARNSNATIIVSGYTQSEDKFPSTDLLNAMKNCAASVGGEDETYSVRIDSKDLDNVLKRLRAFAGDSVICDVKFGKSMIITAVAPGVREERIKDMVPFVREADSANVDGYTFKMAIGVLSIFTTLHDGEFVLHMKDSKSPFYSESISGVKLIATPYWTKEKNDANLS